MPGVHAVLYGPPEGIDRFHAALEDQKSDPFVTPEVLWELPNHGVAFSGHAAYPRRILSADGIRILIEGAIYNRTGPEIDAGLLEVAEALKAGSALDRPVRDFMELSDGDYLVVLYLESRQEMVVFNDKWGRLPAYYHQGAGGVAFSRTVSFLLHWVPEIRLDPIRMAEFLMMGYTLGAGTLVEEIARFMPGSLLHARIVAGRIHGDVRQVAAPVFSDRPDVTRDEALERCSALFLQSVERRLHWCTSENLKITSDVTGGRDSRSIYVAMSRLGMGGDFYSDDLAGSHECDHLPALAKIYGRPITCIPQREPRPDYEEMRRLTFITDCTVNCWSTFLVEQKTLLRREHVRTPSVRFMGLGAHVIKTIPTVPFLYRTMGQLVRDDAFCTLFSSREAAWLLDLDAGKLAGHVRAHFESYPEPGLAHQLKRKYVEYEHALVNAGEDRQRRHFWTIAPFCSSGFIAYVMTELPTAMLNRDFFDRFMERIDPRATEVPYSLKGAASGSGIRRLKYRLTERLKGLFSGWPLLKLRRKYKRYVCAEYRRAKTATALDRELLKAFDETPAAAEYFSPQAVRRIASSRVGKAKKHQLLTLLLYLAEIHRRFPAGQSPADGRPAPSRGH